MIPIKCHTCGAVIADKYRYYLEEVRKRKMNNDVKKSIFMTKINCEKTHEGIVLDNLLITKACCRTRMLTHVEIL